MLGKSIKSESKNFDIFYHYDSSEVDPNDPYLKIKLPKEGIYYITVHGIGLKFPDAYVKDIYTGYICLTNLSTPQAGNIILAENQTRTAGGLMYPLQDLTTNYPKSKNYNKVYLSPQESLGIHFCDKNLAKVTMDRIVVLLHIVDDLSLVYVD